MSSITIELTEEQLTRLQSIANRVGASVETLARSNLEEFIASHNDEFESAANNVLKKNAELYCRLA